MLSRFDIIEPSSVTETCRLLHEHAAEGARILAGGTDLLVDLQQPIVPQHRPRCSGCRPGADESLPRSQPPALIISIGRLGMLKGVEETKDGGIRIGPLTTITELEESPLIQASLPALADAAAALGSPLVRNRGTIGGNVANARPAADTVIPSIALGGEIELASAAGIRQIQLESFPTGPGSSSRHPEELITGILFALPPSSSGSAFIKLAQRKSLEIAVVNVASFVTLDKPDGIFLSARICLGAVGPTPLLAGKAMAYLVGRKADAAHIAEAALRARDDARPITDHRAGREYRLEMVEVLVRRTLARAVKRAGGG